MQDFLDKFFAENEVLSALPLQKVDHVRHGPFPAGADQWNASLADRRLTVGGGEGPVGLQQHGQVVAGVAHADQPRAERG